MKETFSILKIYALFEQTLYTSIFHMHFNDTNNLASPRLIYIYIYSSEVMLIGKEERFQVISTSSELQIHFTIQ